MIMSNRDLAVHDPSPVSEPDGHLGRVIISLIQVLIDAIVAYDARVSSGCTFQPDAAVDGSCWSCLPRLTHLLQFRGPRF
jgi:hypothetical protein